MEKFNKELFQLFILAEHLKEGKMHNPIYREEC